jgi:hypothetical protein
MNGPSPATEELAVIRVIRRPAFQDLVRAHTVLIDGSLRKQLWAFQRRDYPVSPGHHTLKLRIGGSGTSESAEFSVEVGAGETRVFRTKKMGWKKVFLAPLAVFFPDRFAPRPWIQMEQVDGKT